MIQLIILYEKPFKLDFNSYIVYLSENTYNQIIRLRSHKNCMIRLIENQF